MDDTCPNPTTMLSPPVFEGFPRMARLQREIVITEKIDGTNASVFITDDGSQIFAASRTRWITPENDNYGFARWVSEHKTELLTLGPGRHFGEWFGEGIQRRYGLTEKRFALFNVGRWGKCTCEGTEAFPICTCGLEDPPECCTVVPVLYRGPFNTAAIDKVMDDLFMSGSVASPGFGNPEGIVIYHTAAKAMFKRTFEHDETGKPE